MHVLLAIASFLVRSGRKLILASVKVTYLIFQDIVYNPVYFQTAKLPSQQTAAACHLLTVCYCRRGVCRQLCSLDTRNVELQACLSGRLNASAWAEYLVCNSLSVDIGMTVFSHVSQSSIMMVLDKGGDAVLLGR